jgi:hypothetical protein
MKMQYHNSHGGNDVSPASWDSSGGALGCSPKYIYQYPCTALLRALPFPGLPRQPQNGLPYGGTCDAILLGRPGIHYERRPAECLLYLSSSLSSFIARSASYYKYLLVCVSSAALKGHSSLAETILQQLAKLCWGPTLRPYQASK